MTSISRETIEKVANLARLEITKEEAEKTAKQLGDIITMVEKLNNLDTTNVEPTSHPLEVKNVFREDIKKPGLPREKVLKNAPETQDGMFKVPAILED